MRDGLERGSASLPIVLACCWLFAAPDSATAQALLGDVDGDGTVTLGDALRVQQHVQGVTLLSADLQTVADVWPNPGTVGKPIGDDQVTEEDARRLLRYVVGLLTDFELRSDGSLRGATQGLASQAIPYLRFPPLHAGDISGDEELGGYPCSRTRLMLVFADNATVADANAALAAVNGRIVGGLPEYGVVLVAIPDVGDSSGTASAIAILEADPAVALVTRDLVVPMPEPVAADPATERSATHPGYGHDQYWNTIRWAWELVPAGGNWGLEYIRMAQAWNVADKVPSATKVNVVVLDEGFDTSHPDLKITISPLTLNEPARHGTHVAGTIGAAWDGPLRTNMWQQGVDGVNPFASLTGLRYRLGTGSLHLFGLATKWSTTSLMVLGLVDAVATAARPRIINASLGYPWEGRAVQRLAQGKALQEFPFAIPGPNAAVANPKTQKEVANAGTLVAKIMQLAQTVGPVLLCVAAGNESNKASLGNMEVPALWGSPFTHAALRTKEPEPSILVVEAVGPPPGGATRRGSAPVSPIWVGTFPHLE